MDYQLALSNLGQLLAGLIGILIFTAIVLAMLPVGECDRCQHCRLERVTRNEKTAALARRYWGLPTQDDPTCPLHKIPRSKCQSQHED